MYSKEEQMGRRPSGRSRIDCFHDIEEKMVCASYQNVKDAANDINTNDV